MDNPTPPRRLRRRWKVMASLLFLALLLLGMLPTILSTSLARSRIRAGVNQAFAPGKVEFESIELSWFAPTRLWKVVLLDPKDKVVARVPTAVIDKTLGNLIFPGHEPITLSLDATALEIERSTTGKVDLAEALQTIIANPDPKRDLTIRIDHGTLTYRDPFLAEPSTAGTVDLVLRIPAAPNPVTWSLKLAEGPSTLEIQGDFDRWLSKGGSSLAPELQVGVTGKQWPFVAKVGEVDGQGKLDGTLDFVRKRGHWILAGDARLLGLRAQGKALVGDTLAIEKLEAGWDLRQGDEGWTVRRLALNCPLGEIKSEGQIQGANGTGKQRIEGKVDLAAIARQLPHALRLRNGLTVEKGSAKVAVDLNWTSEATTYEVEARLSDLAAKDHDRTLTLREPATLTGRVIRQGQDSSVEQLTLKTSFLDARAKGRFEEGVMLEARLDLAGLRRQLGDWVDLGSLELAGRVDLTGTYRALPTGVSAYPDDLPSLRESGIPAKVKSSTPAHFIAEIDASGHDLRLDGLGVGAIRRDLMDVNLSTNGLVDTSGFPIGWNSAFAHLKSAKTEARVRLDPADEKTRIAALVRTPIGSDDRASTAEMELAGEWSPVGRILAFDEFVATLRSVGTHRIRESDPRPSDRTLLSARGQIDFKSDELVLEPLPGKLSTALAIGPDGVRLSGLGQGIEAIRFEGGISGDSAIVDQLVADLTGRSPLGLSGRWSALANGRGDGDGLQMAAKICLVEETARPGRPTSMAVTAHYSPKLDRLDVSEFAVSTAFGTLDAAGHLDQPMGTRTVDLTGKLSPDFAAITALLVSKVEKGAKVDGRPRSFRATGSLADSSGGWKGLDAEFGFDLVEADIYGMKFGATPVVLRARNGKLSFDPISTSINEGHIRLEPELDLDSADGPTLRLAKNSTIREARINDEVSKRVLAFVAPVLDQATRASGLVSVDLDHAEFPIGAGRGRQAKVEGAVVFQDVEFAPGPLAGEILGAIGRRDLSLKLDQPVTLTIADGRINQRGMSIPIADFTRVELSGWVDFDRKIALVATVPVTSAMLGNYPLLSDIAAGTKVRLPIGGTLDKPEIDREAFSTNLQELAKTLLTRGATRGAMELLMRLGRPKDPDAPPPPPRMTPEERKAQRQEKKAIRRGEIPQPDPNLPK